MKFITGMLAGILTAIIVQQNLHQTVSATIIDRFNRFTGSAEAKDLRLTTKATSKADTNPGKTLTLPKRHSEAPRADNRTATATDIAPALEALQTTETASTNEGIIEPKTLDGTSPEPDPIFQVAWIPFRSEASASGFAEKLSLQIGKEFQAVRVGAGHYQVGFLYHNPKERAEILDAIESITGYRVAERS